MLRMAIDYDLDDIEIRTYPQKAVGNCDRWKWVVIAPDGKTKLGSNVIDGSEADAKREARALIARLAQNARLK